MPRYIGISILRYWSLRSLYNFTNNAELLRKYTSAFHRMSWHQEMTKMQAVFIVTNSFGRLNKLENLKLENLHCIIWLCYSLEIIVEKKISQVWNKITNSSSSCSVLQSGCSIRTALAIKESIFCDVFKGSLLLGGPTNLLGERGHYPWGSTGRQEGKVASFREVFIFGRGGRGAGNFRNYTL